MRVIFMRHGETDANVSDRFASDATLTPEGETQVRSLIEKLEALHSPVNKIYFSSLRRSEQSAKILSDAIGAPMVHLNNIEEFSVGALEGRSDEAAWHAYWDLTLRWLHDSDLEVALPGGESCKQVRDRFGLAIKAVRAFNRPDDTVVIVSHGGALRCALPALLENVGVGFVAQKEHALHNADLVVTHTRGKQLVCETWGGVPVSTRSISPEGPTTITR